MFPRTSILILTALVAQAQSADDLKDVPKFEVSTIKLRQSGAPYHFDDCVNDRFIHSGPILGNLLQWAFDFSSIDAFHQFIRTTSIPQEFYEIQAKAAAPIASMAQCRLMVQALLADRFKMKVHWEEMELDVFDLVIARGGAKLQPALPTDEGTDVKFVMNGVVGTLSSEPAISRGLKGLTMAELANHIGVGGPVTDKTGLEGRYKIELHYTNRPPSTNNDDPGGDPSIEGALAKLGLRVVKHKGIVKIPILDHIEAPDAN